MRIAHISDLHLLNLEGATWSRFVNKRLTGYANLRFKRNHKHRSEYVRALAREIRNAKADEIVITGDITNLALEGEYEFAVKLLHEELGTGTKHVSAVPGNHDVYTRGAMKAGRFGTYFADYMTSDLPELAVPLGHGRFPFVKLRGPLAIIGLSSAVPRPPLVAAGVVGKKQLDALARILAHPEVDKRTPVFLVHHPVHNPRSRTKTLFEGLHDADDLLARIAHLPRGLVLHGHLHKRIQEDVPGGGVVSVGATSASLHHEEAGRMAGFNVYDFDDTGKLANVEAHVLDPSSGTFRVESVPRMI
ncbi:MAG: metallophosphoesterase [Polyangiaceae bacterium]